MTSQKSQDIVAHSRNEPSIFSDLYPKLIGNTCGGLDSVGKSVTKENMKISLNGFAISVILEYMHDLDLEPETDTFLTDNLVNDVSDNIWETWLKQVIEEHDEKAQGENVVQMQVVN